jgi:putative membrane protein
MALTTSAWAQAPNTSAKVNADQTFVMKTANVGMAEVELGTLAMQKSAKSEVKQFGQMMVDDHTKAGEELKALAGQKGIAWPSDLDAAHKATRDKLSKLTGEAFDRAYMDAMVSGHRAAAQEFKAESQSGKDPDVKAWAAKTLPTIEMHLMHAQHVNQMLGTPSSTH